MNYMLVFLSGKVYARSYSEWDMRIFVQEGSPVLVFKEEEDITHLNLEYEWV